MLKIWHYLSYKCHFYLCVQRKTNAFLDAYGSFWKFQEVSQSCKGRTIIFLLGVPILVKKLPAHKKSKKKLSAENFLFKKIVCTTLVKLVSLSFCNLLDDIICSVWLRFVDLV